MLEGFADCMVEIDLTTRDEWSALMGLFDDATIIQSWDFAKVVCPKQQVSRLVLRRSGGVAGLAQVRIVSLPFLKRGIAHVEWGPIWRRRGETPDPQVFAALLTALREEYVVHRKLLLRIAPKITSDFAVEAGSILFATGFNRDFTAREDRTIVKDISAPLADIRMSLEKDWRRDLGRAERNSLEVIRGTSAQYYEEFLPLYYELMKRKGLAPYIDIARWISLQEHLPAAEKPQLIIVRCSGEAIAGLVVSSLGDTGFPIVAAASGAGLKLFASYLMHWCAIAWLKEEGCRFYDLAGIDPENNPGTYHFKRGLKGDEVSFIGRFEHCRDPLSSMVVRTGVRLRELSRRLLARSR